MHLGGHTPHTYTHTHMHTHTYIFTHDSFTHTHTHHFYALLHTLLSRTSLRHTFVAHADPSPSLFSFLHFPSNLYLSFAAYWKKLTCGVIRSFNFWFPGSMLSCFSAFLLFAFPALLVCFSALPAFLFCFFALPASLLLWFTCFFSFLLLCFPFFSAFLLLLLRLSTSTVPLFLFFGHVFLLLYFLLLCFSASCLCCLLVFFCFIFSCL